MTTEELIAMHKSVYVDGERSPADFWEEMEPLAPSLLALAKAVEAWDEYLSGPTPVFGGENETALAAYEDWQERQNELRFDMFQASDAYRAALAQMEKPWKSE